MHSFNILIAVILKARVSKLISAAKYKQVFFNGDIVYTKMIKIWIVNCGSDECNKFN